MPPHWSKRKHGKYAGWCEYHDMLLSWGHAKRKHCLHKNGRYLECEYFQHNPTAKKWAREGFNGQGTER